MAQKDRKTQKLRGSRTHGYGNAQKHRGAGSRGGRGMGGSKKQKWSWIVKNKPGYLGRKGFTKPKISIKNDKITNVGYLSRNIEKLVELGVAQKEGDKYILDMTQTDYTKLLGSGKVDISLDIKVSKASERAIQKIEAAGGSVDALSLSSDANSTDESFEEEATEEGG